MTWAKKRNYFQKVKQKDIYLRNREKSGIILLPTQALEEI